LPAESAFFKPGKCLISIPVRAAKNLLTMIGIRALQIYPQTFLSPLQPLAATSHLYSVRKHKEHCGSLPSCLRHTASAATPDHAGLRA